MIDVEFKYTPSENREAFRAKLFGTEGFWIQLGTPCLIVVLLWVLSTLVFKYSWILLAVCTLATLYAALSIFAVIFGPTIAAQLHSRGKLSKTYRFEIGEDGIRRSIDSEERFVPWAQIRSIEIVGANYLINLDKSGLLLPFARLTDGQREYFYELYTGKLAQ